MILSATAVDKAKPMMSTGICKFLPHAFATISPPGPAEIQNTLNFMANSGTMTNTYKVIILLVYCMAYPQHVKAIYDSRNCNHIPIPLAGAIGNNAIMKKY